MNVILHKTYRIVYLLGFFINDITKTLWIVTSEQKQRTT